MNPTIVEDQSMCKSSVIFHEGETPIDILQNDESFGIVSIELPKMAPINKSIFLKYTIDASDSMSLSDPRYYTRLDYVKETLINMLKGIVVFINDEVQVRLHIDAFSDEVENIVYDTILTCENIDSIILKIQQINTMNMTNIEKSIKKTNEIIEEMSEKYPDFSIAHVFLTDGCPSKGILSVKELKELVSSNFQTTFIGFGIEHNSKLLQEFANTHISHKYLFVDHLSTTGIIYGELIHNILHACLQNICIKIENGEIYNSRKNIWSNTLEIYDMVSEKEYIYHIKNKIHDSTSVSISGTSVLNDEFSHTFENKQPKDLSKYIFRQKTMELLNEAVKERTDSFTDIKKRLNKLFTDIRMYMSEHESNDTFMQTLCDDIYICYKTLGTKHGRMYSISRNTSQREQSYYRAASSLIELPEVKRQICDIFIPEPEYMLYQEEPVLDEIENYTLRYENDSTFINDETVNFINSMSSY